MRAVVFAVAALLVAAPSLKAQDQMPPEAPAPANQPQADTQPDTQPDAVDPADQQAPDDSQPAEDQPAAGDPSSANPSSANPGAAAPAANDPATQPVAPVPQWPVNQKPGQPVVTWDSHGLSIYAANSSLQQILKDVSLATGAKVDGMTGDQRVFGAYGPAPARDVLSQLLQGAGYNVLMIGDLGEGTPRQILLTARRAGTESQAPTATDSDDNSGGDDDSASDNDADDQQQVQPPMRPGFPGGFPRTPQQLLEERQRMMQERQQMIQQQMQRQQQNQPNQPQN